MNTDWRRGSVKTSSGTYLMPWLGETNEQNIQRPSFSIIAHWIATRRPPSPPPPDTFPLHRPNFDVQPSEMRCTWIGHATCFLQAAGFNILTDAVFSNRCSPVQWAGPLRFVPPACSISELPKVHVVLTSHDHYDHLDWHSVADLEKYHRPIYVCGLKLGKWFTDTAGINRERVIELDWWESVTVLDNVNVQFVPVQHWSKRHAYGDERKSLWGGFSVCINEFKFFFNGDTGFNSELYEEIGRRCGPFDLCAIPIGAYEPRSVMTMQHVDPEEAFMIHQLLKSTLSFGIHYATFILTDEPIEEPKIRIEKISKINSDVPPFLAIDHGSSITFDAAKCFKIGLN